VLDKMGKKIELALNIFVPDDILLDRMTGRVSCSKCKTVYNLKYNPPAVPGVCDKCAGELIQRNDDKEETAKNRLKVYMEQTQPLLDYYQKQGCLKDIDGNRDTKKVFADVTSELEKIR
jgi:adenylate kinase